MPSALNLPEQDKTAASYFTGKNVLVTGGGGFIAASLIKLLCAADCRVVRLSRSPTAAWPDPGLAHIEDRIGDVRDPMIWKSLPDGIDVVFHLAAQTSTYEANRDPRADLDSNVLPVLLMLQACRERKISPAVICASTGNTSAAAAAYARRGGMREPLHTRHTRVAHLSRFAAGADSVPPGFQQRRCRCLRRGCVSRGMDGGHAEYGRA